jgi:DNA-binding XRE family transcriptional regulator
MTSKISVHPRELLRLWRERAGLTQWRAAALLGMSQTALCEIERGRRDPPVNLVDRAREVYGLIDSGD